MALVFRIENYDATDTYDMLGNLQLVRGSFGPQAGGDGLVTETLEVISQDTIANMLGDDTALETILEKARRWHRIRTEHESIWLRWHVDGETAKRALIYDYAKSHQPGLTDDPLMELSTIRELLAITRHPYFESVTHTSNNTTGISSLGGEWDLSGSVSGGTIDGRINRVIMGAPSGTEYKKVWIGIVDSPYASASYDPVAECGDGTTGTDTTVSGTTMVTAFVDTSLTHRFSVQIADFGTSDATDLVGRHLVLLRCINGSGTSSAVRLSTSMFSSPATTDPRQVQSIVYTTNTDYRMIEVGEIDIPGPSYRGEMNDLGLGVDQVALNFEVARIGGSGNFTSDAIVLIPSEHLVTWQDAVWRPASAETAEIHTNEDDEVVGFTRQAVPIRIKEQASVSARNWSYPIAGGSFVFAAEDQGGHDRTDTISPTVEIYKRWLTYHG
jgi:hypothetical protein